MVTFPTVNIQADCLYSKDMSKDMVILTTSPAGLGHIRVMEALKQGLPPDVAVATLGIKDARMQMLHRTTSINPYFRRLAETVQHNPLAEGGFTRWYRTVLRHNPAQVLAQIVELVASVETKPDRVIVLCTHFGAGHQLAAVRLELEAQLGTKLVLAVVVTDDSPQHLWAVNGVDYLFVPSESTRVGLEQHLELTGSGSIPRIEVVSYPVAPALAKRLSIEQRAERVRQVKQLRNDLFTLMVPVSGAAVQLGYYQEIISTLERLMPIKVLVVAREHAHTSTFLQWCRQSAHIRVYADTDDHRVVQLYEQAYQDHIITAELTKPSEQLYKALVTPKQVGGALLLLSEPVGRQEEDNLLFLNRHHLMPDLQEWHQLQQVSRLSRRDLQGLLLQARKWRGLVMSHDGNEAGLYIYSLIREGVFEAMMDFEGYMKGHDELRDNGVEQIWSVLLDK
jgi:hypothetical protein